MSHRVGSFAGSLLLIVATAVVVSFLPSLTGDAEGATTIPWVKVKSFTGPITIQAQVLTPVASLPLPAGKYLVLAKAVFNSSDPGRASCILQIGSHSDSSVTPLDSTMVLTAAGKLTEPGAATLNCLAPPGNSVDVTYIKVTATKVGTLTNV